MVVGPDDVSQAAHVRVVEQGNYGSFSRGADLLALLITLLVCTTVVPIVGNTPGDDLARDLNGWQQLLAWPSRRVFRWSNWYTCLLVAVLLLRQLDLAHAASSDCLAQDPFPRLCRYRSPRPGLRLARRPRVGGGGDGSRAGVVCNGRRHGCCRTRVRGGEVRGRMLAGARVRGREDDGDGSALGGGEGSVPLSLLVLLGCWCARPVRSCSCSCCGFGQGWSFSVPAGVAARVGMGVGGRGGAVGNGRGVVVLGLGRLGVEGGGGATVTAVAVAVVAATEPGP